MRARRAEREPNRDFPLPAAPRASSRFATLAQAIRRTPAAVAISTQNGVVRVRRSPDRPCEDGITWSVFAA